MHSLERRGTRSLISKVVLLCEPCPLTQILLKHSCIKKFQDGEVLNCILEVLPCPIGFFPYKGSLTNSRFIFLTLPTRSLSHS